MYNSQAAGLLIKLRRLPSTNILMRAEVSTKFLGFIHRLDRRPPAFAPMFIVATAGGMQGGTPIVVGFSTL